MIAWAKCPRCGESAAHHSTLTLETKLCGGCIDAERAAVRLSIRASLVARAVPTELADQIVNAAVASIPSPNDPRDAGRDERMETLSVIGAGAWERWVASHDQVAASQADRVERLLALRPYRRAVVRVILEALERDARLSVAPSC